MSDGFRIITARAVASTQARSSRKYPTVKMPPASVGVSFQLPDITEKRNDGTHVSVVLGRNGQGKSRLLSAIAEAFELLSQYRTKKPRRRFPLTELSYVIDGRLHEIVWIYGNYPTLRIDGQLREMFEAKLPQRVIALSMTPFDKFPMGSEVKRRASLDGEPPLYTYFGMRDRTGRASVSALLDRAILGLLSRNDSDDRFRIAKVFDLIGYTSELNILWRPESLTFLRELLHVRGYQDLNIGERYGLRIQAHLRATGVSLWDVQEAAGLALKLLDEDGLVEVEFDIQHPTDQARHLFSQMQLLRQCGLMRLASVEAQRTTGELLDLKLASSGELSIAISFMSLASTLQDASLVLIDEPEINLHPEWQAKYIDLLTSTFSSFNNCHFVLATHSPLVLSDAPPWATVCSVSDRTPDAGADVSGQPVDYLLAKAFQTVSSSNYYLQEMLMKAVTLAADGRTSSQEFREALHELVEMKSLIRDGNGIVELISGLENIANTNPRLKP